MKAKRQERGASAVGEESEVANAHEAFWKQVLCFAKTLIRTGNRAIRWRDSLKRRLGWDPQGAKFSPAGNAARAAHI